MPELLWRMIYNDQLWQSINETNQESEYLQLCRSKTDCQSRIHFLLEAVCLTFNSTRPSPVTAYPLQIKFESIIIIISNAQNSAFYTDYLATKCLVSFIGHKVTCLLGHKVPYFFYWPQSALFCWPQSGQCICIVITSFIVFGHKLAHAFDIDTASTLFNIPQVKGFCPYYFCFLVCNTSIYSINMIECMFIHCFTCSAAHYVQDCVLLCSFESQSLCSLSCSTELVLQSSLIHVLFSILLQRVFQVLVIFTRPFW